jgi:transposase
MSYFLGFDVAKSKLDYSLINEQGIEQIYGSVSNEAVAIASLLLTVAGNYLCEHIVCVVEATGCYHHSLAETCHAIDTPCLIYNPLMTKQ